MRAHNSPVTRNEQQRMLTPLMGLLLMVLAPSMRKLTPAPKTPMAPATPLEA